MRKLVLAAAAFVALAGFGLSGAGTASAAEAGAYAALPQLQSLLRLDVQPVQYRNCRRVRYSYRCCKRYGYDYYGNRICRNYGSCYGYRTKCYGGGGYHRGGGGY